MEKYFEINYTIEDIQGMSREEQLEYLEYLYDLRTEIMRQIDDKKSFYSEISYLIGEIEEKNGTRHHEGNPTCFEFNPTQHSYFVAS